MAMSSMYSMQYMSLVTFVCTVQDSRNSSLSMWYWRDISLGTSVDKCIMLMVSKYLGRYHAADCMQQIEEAQGDGIHLSKGFLV